MSTTTEAMAAVTTNLEHFDALRLDTLTNRVALEHLRTEGIVLPDDPLALNVEAKIDAGEALTPAEAGILWYGITEDVLEFIRQHPTLLGSAQL
jgi:hypothetical protein